MHKVFAFGTLKRGFPLHERGLSGAAFLGRCRTLEAYPMFVAGPWFAPMMLDRRGAGTRVFGELYEVDDDRLALIDDLESIGKTGNFRRIIVVEHLERTGRHAAVVYMKSAELARPAHTGYLDDYQDGRFVPPERRPQQRQGTRCAPARGPDRTP